MNEVLLGLLVVLSCLPFRSTCLTFNVDASTDWPSLEVNWTRQPEDPSSDWGISLVFYHNNTVVTDKSIWAPNQSAMSGNISFTPPEPTPNPINLTLQGFFAANHTVFGNPSEHFNFSVSSSGSPTVTVTVTKSDSHTSSSSYSAQPSFSEPGLSPTPESNSDITKSDIKPGTIAGAIIGTVTFLFIAVVALIFWLRRRRRRAALDPASSASAFDKDRMVREIATDTYRYHPRDSLDGTSTLDR